MRHDIDPADLPRQIEIPKVLAIIIDAARAEQTSAAEIISARLGSFRMRCAVAWAARQAHEFSLPAIGRALGGRHHTTILNALRRAEQLREADQAFRALSDFLLARALRRVTLAQGITK